MKRRSALTDFCLILIGGLMPLAGVVLAMLVPVAFLAWWVWWNVYGAGQ